MAVIFGASALSDPGPLLPEGLSDKSGHFLGYAILSALLLRALAGGRVSGITWRAALLAILLSTVYGVSDEFHQSFVPGRSPDAADVLADALGACGAAVLGGILRLLVRPRPSDPSVPD
jgi:VanZ family protein